MPVRGHFDLSGLDEYIQAFVDAELDVNDIVAENLDEAASPVLSDMKAHVRKDTHELENHLAKSEPTREGNQISVEVGLLDLGPQNIPSIPQRRKYYETHRNMPRGKWHQFYYGVIEEFGTAIRAAHPYIRPALKKAKKFVKEAMQKTLEGFGL